MHRRTAPYFLVMGALTCALLAGSSLEGCQGHTSVTNDGAGGGSTASSSSTTSSSSSSTTLSSSSSSSGTGDSGIGDAATTSSSGTGCAPTTSSSSVTSSSSSSTGGTGTVGDGGVVTIEQLTDPTSPGFIGSGPVELAGVVATSTKFLSSKSPTGECLWGVFISSPGLATAAPHSAILALSYGSPATSVDGGPAYCPVLQANQPAGDAFPDDTKPGDILDIVGSAGAYLPNACTSSPPGPPYYSSHVAQYQLGNVVKADRTGSNGQVPAPHVLSCNEAAQLAAGLDAAFFDAWGGARVALQGVTAELQIGALLDEYGHMLMNDGIQVGDKLYYVGAVQATDACHASPTFATQTPTFSSITGFVYLDYCTWNMQPADKCHDLSPPSADCASVAGAGADAGPATVCTH